jgi:hypothetical protein
MLIHNLNRVPLTELSHSLMSHMPGRGCVPTWNLVEIDARYPLELGAFSSALKANFRCWGRRNIQKRPGSCAITLLRLGFGQIVSFAQGVSQPKFRTFEWHAFCWVFLRDEQ